MWISFSWAQCKKTAIKRALSENLENNRKIEILFFSYDVNFFKAYAMLSFSFQFPSFWIVKGILTFGTQPIAFDCLSLAGLIRQPKWGHLKELHKAIKLCEPALASGNPIVTSLGNFQQVSFFECTIDICIPYRNKIERFLLLF